MAKPWTEFLEELRGRHPSLLAFAFHWWHYNVPLLQRIRETVPPPAKILEVGTGTGALVVLLAAHGYEAVGVDIDPQVLEAAKAFAEHFHMPCRFEIADGFDLARYAAQFDLTFSAGVLEHFSTDDAARLLQEQARAATYVLAAVPTWHALRHDPLTEASGARPIRLGELRGIFRRAGLQVLRGFGYGTPDGGLAVLYRALLPRAIQWVLQNRFSYACTVGCIGCAPSPRPRGGAT